MTPAELLALARAATPGPWRHNPAATRHEPVWRIEYTAKGMNRGASFVIANMEGTEGNDIANARFIAAANPATVIALCERIAALEAGLREACDGWAIDAGDDPRIGELRALAGAG